MNFVKPQGDQPVNAVRQIVASLEACAPKTTGEPAHPVRGFHKLAQAPLVLGCHHKTGSVLLIQLMDRLLPRLNQKRRLNKIVSGSPMDRKAPLSGILNHYRGCDCYVNLWFEHEIDVPSDSIRLLHFVRHPVKWVRSAYLYHKKGAPSDLIRWLDWRVFRFKGEELSYFEVLNRLDTDRKSVV